MNRAVATEEFFPHKNMLTVKELLSLQLAVCDNYSQLTSHVTQHGLKLGEAIVVVDESAIYVGRDDGTALKFHGEVVNLPSK